MVHDHRSCSSSFSHVQPQQQVQPPDVNSQSMDPPLPFVSSPEHMDIQTTPAKDYGIHDTNSQQQHAPFDSAHMFEQAQTHPHPLYEQSQASFDHTNGSSGASADGMSYNQVSSPFSNGSGESNSPFTATSSGHPPTPTFASHQSTPPVFGPPPTSATSPATYFHGSSSFTSYATNSPTQSSNLQHHGNGSGMALMGLGMDTTIMTPVLENPIYDKSQQQQHAIYDPKPSVMDNMSRHHHQRQQHEQHFQHPSYDDGSQNHRHMVATWPSPPPSHRSSMSAQNGQPFWDNGEGFKFFT